MRNFLAEVDLGLVSPENPPSLTNPELKTMIPRTMAGLTTTETIWRLILIYLFRTYGLYSPNGKPCFSFNDLMRKYFSEDIRQINLLDPRLVFPRGKINMNNVPLHEASISLAQWTTALNAEGFDLEKFLDLKNLLKTVCDFDPLTELVGPDEHHLSPQEEEIVTVARDKYLGLFDEQFPYYSTKGDKLYLGPDNIPEDYEYYLEGAI